MIPGQWQQRCSLHASVTGWQFTKVLMMFTRNMKEYYSHVGRVFVYGGHNVNDIYMASVEMLSTDRHVWQPLPSPMFAADFYFSSVPLP